MVTIVVNWLDSGSLGAGRSGKAPGDGLRLPGTSDLVGW